MDIPRTSVTGSCALACSWHIAIMAGTTSIETLGAQLLHIGMHWCSQLSKILYPRTAQHCGSEWHCAA